MVNRFARYAWGTIGFTVAVIAGGAIVRATGSGAGCGSHWPRCNGSIVPGGSTESIIEFTHRATSGLALLAVVGLFVWARRLPTAHVRRGAGASLAFMIGEVIIGAILVLGEWVGDDASVARAVIDGLHLVNTLFLLGALTLTAWWASGGAPITLRPATVEGRMLMAGLAAIVVVAAAGALTALGDTLFPDAGVADDFSESSHFLVRMRVIHPVLAVVAAVYLIGVARRLRLGSTGLSARLASIAAVLVGVQLVVGITNLALGAPIGIQVVHLALTDAIWITLVVLTATQLERKTAPV